jgi:hypothetical protein
VLGRATGNTDTQNSPRPKLRGSHHLPPYNILCTSPRGPHPNGFLSRYSQVGVSKSPRLGLPWLWGAITLRTDLWLRWSLKQSCSPRQELSNSMSHAIFTHKNQVDSRLLVVKNQIVNLTPGPSFGHNLCFRCSNGQCKPILDIYVPRAFHWYKEFLKPLSLTPSENLRVHEYFNSQSGIPLGCEGSFPHTFSHSRKYVVWLSASLLACNLINPCLSHKPKAKVATNY